MIENKNEFAQTILHGKIMDSSAEKIPAGTESDDQTVFQQLLLNRNFQAQQNVKAAASLFFTPLATEKKGSEGRRPDSMDAETSHRTGQKEPFQSPSHKSAGAANPMVNGQTAGKEGEGEPTDCRGPETGGSRASGGGESAVLHPARFSAQFLSQRQAGRQGRDQAAGNRQAAAGASNDGQGRVGQHEPTDRPMAAGRDAAPTAAANPPGKATVFTTPQAGDIPVPAPAKAADPRPAQLAAAVGVNSKGQHPGTRSGAKPGKSDKGSGKKTEVRARKSDRGNTDGTVDDDYLDDLQEFGTRQESEQEADSENERSENGVLEELYGKSLAHSSQPVSEINGDNDRKREKSPVDKEKPVNRLSADFNDRDREAFDAKTAVHHTQPSFKDFDISMTIAAETLRHTLQPFAFEQVAGAIIAAGTSDPFQKEVRIRIKESVLKGTEVRIRREGQKLLVHFITEADISFQQLTAHCEDLKSCMRKMLGIGKRRGKRNEFGEFDEIEIEIEKIDQLADNPFMKRSADSTGGSSATDRKPYPKSGQKMNEQTNRI